MTAAPLADVSPEILRRATEIAAVGMLMVFAALALLCVFLAILPRVLARINSVWPEAVDRHAVLDGADQLLDEEDEVLAAIGFVLHADARELP
jgi:Na+-transporting methylmalonyl-CoA/oxaloacetate decarboxylase gamma subunit